MNETLRWEWSGFNAIKVPRALLGFITGLAMGIPAHSNCGIKQQIWVTVKSVYLAGMGGGSREGWMVVHDYSNYKNADLFALCNVLYFLVETLTKR